MALQKKLSKNQRRRLKKKQQKKAAREAAAKQAAETATNGKVEEEPGAPPPPPAPEQQIVPKVEVEYVFDQEFKESITKAFSEEGVNSIFERFKTPEQLTNQEEEEDTKAAEDKKKKADAEAAAAAAKAAEKPKLSRRKKKLQSRLSVAQLKQLVKRPDVVEVHDVTAADPRLLVYLKSYRNTVPVPRHWCHKRKYLQGKRGIEKPPFSLPDFIEATGISKIRATVQEKDDGKSLKQRARERMNAKMGKIDIDYQVLYTAFFKNQTKPPLTIHGDVYYEKKEFETKLREKRPGQLSEELKIALGMPEGAPPPWLINMQRYGPPPSYPKLKIAGLNAPIPPGASFGYHPGGWGKPPVDEFGRPLYGDVFGTAPKQEEEPEHQIDRSHWGEIEEVEEEDEDEADMEGDDDATDVDDMTGIETPMDETGISSVTSGLETPDTIDLRKGTRSTSSMGTDTPSTPQLYKILEQQQAGVGNAMYGSDKRYVMPSASGTKKTVSGSEVAVALDPSELENLDDEQLKAKYDQAKADQGPMPQKRKRKSRFGQSAAKKAKDFKF